MKNITQYLAAMYTGIATQMGMLKDEKAQMGTMELVIAVAIGLIVLAAVFSLAPVIGDKIDSSVDVPAGSEWNTSENPGIPTGVDIWSDNASLISLVVLVMIISLAIFYIRRMGGGSGGAGGM